jgi:hypothetical protein
MANKNPLIDYVKEMAKTFEMPDCMFQETNDKGQVEDDGPGQVESAELPRNHLLIAGEI